MYGVGEEGVDPPRVGGAVGWGLQDEEGAEEEEDGADAQQRHTGQAKRPQLREGQTRGGGRRRRRGGGGGGGKGGGSEQR